MKRHVLHGILAVLLLIGAGVALYATAFFAWVTATPVEPEELAQAKNYANAWLAVVGASFILFLGNLVIWVRRSRRGA